MRVLLFKKKKEIKHIIGVFVFYFSINFLLYPMCGVQKVDSVIMEKFANSFKFQQTARYVQKHQDELTNDEIEIIDGVLNYKVLFRYDPYMADPVMGEYHSESKQALQRYQKLWLKHLKKDPAVYVGAYLQYVYLYVYPFDVEHFSFLSKFQINGGIRDTGYFDLYRNEVFTRSTDRIVTIHSMLRKIPIVSILYSSGFFGWILILSIVYSLNRNKRSLVLLSPLIINFIICVGTFFAVNGSLRFSYPVVLMALPMALYLYDTKGLI